MTTQQRSDLTQSFEDYERVMEDYFQLIPLELRFFTVEKASRWEYNEFERSMTFYFVDEWTLDEFLDTMKDCPKKFAYDFEEYEHVDRKNLTIKMIGRIGGLY